MLEVKIGMVKYVLVSQGVKIYETYNRDEAAEIVSNGNNKWLDYKQECLDNHEPYADNEIEIFEEEEQLA